MDNAEKVRENRLRRMAERQGMMLVKSRRRDPYADDFGLYVLVDDSAGNKYGRRGGQAAISDFAKGFGMDLDGVEETLMNEERAIDRRIAAMTKTKPLTEKQERIVSDVAELVRAVAYFKVHTETDNEKNLAVTREELHLMVAVAADADLPETRLAELVGMSWSDWLSQ